METRLVGSIVVHKGKDWMIEAVKESRNGDFIVLLSDEKGVMRCELVGNVTLKTPSLSPKSTLERVKFHDEVYP